tara:strand:+ start:591 stop:797 length:207 start_codon:yes stop_codon:yes gene_type:complete
MNSCSAKVLAEVEERGVWLTQFINFKSKSKPSVPLRRTPPFFNLFITFEFKSSPLFLKEGNEVEERGV